MGTVAKIVTLVIKHIEKQQKGATMWHKENTGMRKRMKGIVKAVLALSMCLVMPFTAIPAAAAENEFPDLDRTGSLTITYTYYNENTGKTEVVSGGNSVGLFKVADVVIDNGFKFKVDERFASAGEIPATSEELEAANVDLATAMEAIAADYDFDVPSRETDANGQVSFDGLEVGLYLVMQDARGEGENRYFLSPFLITIPYRNADGSLSYDITADAKPIGIYKEQVPPPIPPTPPTIPQTGQLWWPVAALGAAGVLLVVMGMVRRGGSK